MADVFSDDRGVIRDLLTEPLDAVTHIFTNEGAIRGNHLHRSTVQWTYVICGSLLVAAQKGSAVTLRTAVPGDLICDEPGVAHAWKALEDTEVLVFTRGPRSGAAYESDVERLAEPLL